MNIINIHTESGIENSALFNKPLFYFNIIRKQVFNNTSVVSNVSIPIPDDNDVFHISKLYETYVMLCSFETMFRQRCRSINIHDELIIINTNISIFTINPTSSSVATIVNIPMNINTIIDGIAEFCKCISPVLVDLIYRSQHIYRPAYVFPPYDVSLTPLANTGMVNTTVTDTATVSTTVTDTATVNTTDTATVTVNTTDTATVNTTVANTVSTTVTDTVNTTVANTVNTTDTATVNTTVANTATVDDNATNDMFTDDMFTEIPSVKMDIHEGYVSRTTELLNLYSARNDICPPSARPFVREHHIHNDMVQQTTIRKRKKVTTPGDVNEDIIVRKCKKVTNFADINENNIIYHQRGNKQF